MPFNSGSWNTFRSPEVRCRTELMHRKGTQKRGGKKTIGGGAFCFMHNSSAAIPRNPQSHFPTTAIQTWWSCPPPSPPSEISRRPPPPSSPCPPTCYFHHHMLCEGREIDNFWNIPLSYLTVSNVDTDIQHKMFLNFCRIPHLASEPSPLPPPPTHACKLVRPL